MWLIESLLVGAVFLLFAWLVCVWQDRARPETRVERLADPTPMPGELGYGPFPVDTGPLLILSDKAAANAALERDVAAMIAESWRIPERWNR